MKRFIPFVPLLPPDKPVACRYAAGGNPALAYDRGTRFVMIPVMHGPPQPKDKIQVIAAASGCPNARANVQKFQRTKAGNSTISEQHSAYLAELRRVPGREL